MYNIPMLSDELIKRLRNDNVFQEFQKYVLDEMAKLDSIDSLKDMSNEKAGETVRARAMAVDVLEKIFGPIIDFREKVDYPLEVIQGKKDRYGI